MSIFLPGVKGPLPDDFVDRVNARHDRWPALDRDHALQLATVTAPADPFGAIPINDDTLPDESFTQRFREGIDHLKARNGRRT